METQNWHVLDHVREEIGKTGDLVFLHVALFKSPCKTIERMNCLFSK